MFLASLAGERAARDDRALAAHLHDCAVCRAETERLAALWMQLGTLPEAQPDAASRARFDRMLAAWQDGAPAAPGWGGRVRDWFATWGSARPAGQWAGAVALVACGFIAGS